MPLIVNGEKCAYRTPGSLKQLLVKLKVKPGRAAILVNDEIIARKKFSSTVLKAGDRVEILTLATGG